MAGDIQSRETEVVGAIADIIVAQTTILPQTTLHQAGGSHVGDAALTLADASHFAQRGYLQWFDNSGERFAPIASVVGNLVTLDYSGYATAGLTGGLRFLHADGVIVATNLMTHQPSIIGPMLRGGDPVIAIWPKVKDTGEWTEGSTLSPLVVRIQVHLPINIAESDPIDPEVWNDYQQDRCRAILQTIENTLAFRQNRRLIATYNSPGNHALGLGIDGKRWARTGWGFLTEEIDIPQAVAAMDVTVRPQRGIY